MSITAEELDRKLALDEDYQNRRKKLDEKFDNIEKFLSHKEQGLLLKLADIGIYINSIYDLVNSPNNYSVAIPLLIRELREDHHPRIMEGIVRSLTIRTLNKNEDLWSAIYDLLKKTKPNKQMEDPLERGLQGAIVALIYTFSIKANIDRLEKIVNDYPEIDDIDALEEKLEKLKKRM